MSNKVSTAIVLFKKRKKKNGTYPAKLRLTHDRKQMYYNIDTKDRVYEFTEEEFEKITSPKPRGEFKEIQIEFSLIEEKAKKVIQSLSDFNFDKFKSHMGITGSNMRNIFYYLDLKAKESDEKCFGNKVYRPLKTALQKFFNKKEVLLFKEVTPQKLREFEKYMLDKGMRPTTFFNYITGLKTVYLIGLKSNLISSETFPFGRDKDKYKVAQVVTVKRALKLSEIEKIYNYKPEPFSAEEEARDYWLFTYLCNGINMMDLCHLKYRNLGPDFISFYRSKTEHSTSIRKTITVPISKDLRRLINKLGNKDKSPDNYVFPVINDSLTYKQKMYKVAWRIRKTNVHMQKIGKQLGIEKNITTYTARHSFATILKRSGVSTAFISESLGHSDIGVTEVYLDSFEDDYKKEIAKHLTAFKN